jgi:hypothetical protein
VVPQSLTEVLIFRLPYVDHTEIVVERIDATLLPDVRLDQPGSDRNLTEKCAFVAGAALPPVNDVWIPELTV